MGRAVEESSRRLVGRLLLLRRNFVKESAFLRIRKKERQMARYSKSASRDVKGAMERRKAGTLKSGKSGKTVKSKKQAIAIGLSEARANGKKVPSKKSA
jgi:hypothetical protein